MVVIDTKVGADRDTERGGSRAMLPPKGATLAVASIATALVLIVFTVPLTTLTSTAHALGAGPGAKAWVLSAMSVGAASGLLASGAIGDDYGRRRTFLAGTMLLAAASVVGAIASTAFLLIIARVAQGLGGAAILACGLGLIGQAYPGKALGAAALGAGVAVGPILAAGLNGLGGWPAAYWFSAAASAVLAVAGRIFLPESNAAHPRRIDFAGTLLLGFAMAALLAGLTQSWPHSSRSSAALPAQCLISRYSGGLTSRALSLLRLPQAQPDGLG